VVAAAKAKLTVIARLLAVVAGALAVIPELVAPEGMKLPTDLAVAAVGVAAAQGDNVTAVLEAAAAAAESVFTAQEATVLAELQMEAAGAVALLAALAALAELTAVMAGLTAEAAGALGGMEALVVEETRLFVLFGVKVALVAPRHSHQLTWDHK
jgi:hypothetical protein